jgi:hypothetical protein
MSKSLPTWQQAQTLKMLMEGWELIITEWCAASYQIMLDHAREKKRKRPSPERIYWRKHEPKFKLYPYDTIECGSAKMKRHMMSHLERYGWVIRSKTGWTITDAGRKAAATYDEYWNQYNAAK